MSDFVGLTLFVCLTLFVAPSFLVASKVLSAWSALPICYRLHQLLADRCLSYRVYFPLQFVLADMQVAKKLRTCGLDKEASDDAADRCSQAICEPMKQYWSGILPHLVLGNVKKALQPIRRTNMVFVRIDRNPGRGRAHVTPFKGFDPAADLHQLRALLS